MPVFMPAPDTTAMIKEVATQVQKPGNMEKFFFEFSRAKIRMLSFEGPVLLLENYRREKSMGRLVTITPLANSIKSSSSYTLGPNLASASAG